MASQSHSNHCLSSSLGSTPTGRRTGELGTTQVLITSWQRGPDSAPAHLASRCAHPCRTASLPGKEKGSGIVSGVRAGCLARLATAVQGHLQAQRLRRAHLLCLVPERAAAHHAPLQLWQRRSLYRLDVPQPAPRQAATGSARTPEHGPRLQASPATAQAQNDSRPLFRSKHREV